MTDNAPPRPATTPARQRRMELAKDAVVGVRSATPNICSAKLGVWRNAKVRHRSGVALNRDLISNNLIMNIFH